jgi:hypothetical protein
MPITNTGRGKRNVKRPARQTISGVAEDCDLSGSSTMLAAHHPARVRKRQGCAAFFTSELVLTRLTPLNSEPSEAMENLQRPISFVSIGVHSWFFTAS